jgi:hypothetical protein
MRASPNRRRVRTTALVERAGNKHGRRPISDHPRQKLQGHGVRSPSDIILKDGDLRKEETRRDETRGEERREDEQEAEAKNGDRETKTGRRGGFPSFGTADATKTDETASQ